MSVPPYETCVVEAELSKKSENAEETKTGVAMTEKAALAKYHLYTLLLRSMPS